VFQPLVQRWKQTWLSIKVQAVAEGRCCSCDVDGLHLHHLLSDQSASPRVKNHKTSSLSSLPFAITGHLQQLW